ncbi:helix-turn-helix transcriptional regulator (plasmid) [Streptomyces sp. NBC_00841]|uniref:helix-turn-helix domain-containing protein n=1 Tax=Streptomyces sp. NBC_00841 TaxID=2975847 RepID=UPI002DD8E42D|nr:helix-turn-helix transcriptional regulator [Streptomyces sp. NBC_00841]WSA05335.1 helix-turn-helix transcriptional regulator [Streptomyces sp. NBC_00841]
MSKATFSRLLREARQRSVFTLEGLAEASGMSVRAISDMERGRSLPRQSTLSDLVTPPPRERGGFSLCRCGFATDQPGP